MKMLPSIKSVLLACVCGISVFSVQAERIKDMATIAGQRGNQLIGYGLVVGLDGTGENSSLNPMTGQSITNMLSALGVTLPSNQNLQLGRHHHRGHIAHLQILIGWQGHAQR